MSKYRYRIDPEVIDLVDDLGYDESDLDEMSSDDVYDTACDILADQIQVRRV